MESRETPSGGTPQFLNDEARSRYELRLAGELAGHVRYVREGDRVQLTHTEVEPRLQGRGLASQLAAFVLDDLQRRGVEVIPSCSFMARYLERHAQEYAGLRTSQP